MLEVTLTQNTPTTEIFNRFRDSSSNELLIKNYFTCYTDLYGRLEADLLIAKTTEQPCNLPKDGYATPTSFKQFPHRFLLGNLYGDIHPHIKQMAEQAYALMNASEVQLDIPVAFEGRFWLKAQDSRHQTGFGDRYFFGVCVYEGTKYGDGHFYLIKGIMVHK